MSRLPSSRRSSADNTSEAIGHFIGWLICLFGFSALVAWPLMLALGAEHLLVGFHLVWTLVVAGALVGRISRALDDD